MNKTKPTLEEQYKRASKAQKRVLIAKDAIKQIEIGRYKAECGTYFDVLSEGDEDDLRAGLWDGVKCSLCAKGAIFASKVRCDSQAEQLPIGGDRDHDDVVGPVLDVFDQNQLDLIERYFEGYGSAYEWYLEHTDSTKRMLAILRNIIRNKGTFKP